IRFFAGFRLFISEPLLYSNRSSIEPVARRVFTRLSPSVPPGRLSTVTLYFVWAALKQSDRALAIAGFGSETVWRSLISTTPALTLLPDKLPDWQAPVSYTHLRAHETVL